MRFAIPIADNKLTLHFGHSAEFAIVDADEEKKQIQMREDVDAPPHQPGLLPRWLAERGVNVIIAGGIGQRAQALFLEQGIRVLVGAPCDTPEHLIISYLRGALISGTNVCDH